MLKVIAELSNPPRSFLTKEEHEKQAKLGFATLMNTIRQTKASANDRFWRRFRLDLRWFAK